MHQRVAPSSVPRITAVCGGLMNAMTGFIRSENRFARLACFAGFYVASLASVEVMIEGTQMMLGWI
jgi:hypothetical protein